MIHYETINETGKALADRIASANPAHSGEAIVFVGALGICVRKILPLAQDKYTDPAVVCVDSTGKYVIPVLSGHIGGANELARQIAAITGGEAIITTQSDNTDLWALDTLARKNGWGMTHMERGEMNAAIATFVNKHKTALLLEWRDAGTEQMEATLPQHVTLYRNREEIPPTEYELIIVVSPKAYTIAEQIPVLQYYPYCLHLGVGCQHQAPRESALSLLEQVDALGYARQSIATIGTIELKRDEPMLVYLAQLLPQAKLCIHSANELSKAEVPNPSQKVFEVTGCWGVAEAAALSKGDTLVVEKQKGSYNGVFYTFALSQDEVRIGGHIEIVGAGPGDPELISVRGRKFLEQADLILYAGSLVPRELTLCHKPDATVRSSADLDLEEQFELMKTYYDEGKLVVRLHTGDPCIYGAIQEQMAFFDQYGMDYHITPGISSFLAAAAELRSQFTIPERCQSIILTRGEGRTAMPEKEKLHMLAAHQSTMCIFLSASLVEQVQQELLDGGYPPETPVAACYKLTWKDQRIYRGQLRDLVNIIQNNHLTLTTMIVVGDAIDNRSGLSKLYDGHFTHLFRKGK